MTIELSVLMWSGVLLFVLIMLAATGNMMAMGMGWASSNRDDASTADGWTARVRRAYLNLLENLVIYGAVVVPVHLAGIHNEMTVLGAQIFCVARLVHALVYTAGINIVGIRTLAYFAGVIGTALILIQAV